MPRIIRLKSGRRRDTATRGRGDAAYPRVPVAGMGLPLPTTDIKPVLFEQLQLKGSPPAEPGGSACATNPRVREDPEQELKEARHRIQKLIQEAKEESAHLLEEAQKEAEAARKAASEDGYQEGLVRGSREATQQVKEQGESLTTVLENALEEAAALKGKMLDDMESEISSLVIMLTEKLVHCELDSHHEAIVDVVKEAIKLVKDKNNIVIKVSSEDHRVLKEYTPDFLDAVKGMSNVSIDEDQSIKTGGCILETDTEIIDSRLETRFAEAVKLLISDE